MKIDYDPVKDESNRIKHGFSLADGSSLFEDAAHLVLPSIRPIDGEERFKVIGLMRDRLCTGVFVRRRAVLRFISVRRSNHGEERQYRAQG